MLHEFLKRNVVIDADSTYVFVGNLVAVHEKTIELANADVHDFRDSKTTRELYVLDSKVHGIRTNRKRVLIPMRQVVSVSLLDDVVE